MPGQTMIAVVARERCTACGLCVAVCAAGALSVDDVASVDPARCIGCGACVAECPNQALTLEAAAVAQGAAR